MNYLERFFKKYKDIFFVVSRNVSIILLVLLLLDIFNILVVWKYYNIFFMGVIFVVFMVLMIFVKQERFFKENFLLLKNFLLQQNKNLLVELEDTETNEYEKEKKFSGTFLLKFPKIAKIPVLRIIVEWMYKEGWWFSTGLILIIISGVVLRIWNIGQLSPVSDEFRHLIAAKRFISEGFFQYPNSAATWIVIFMKKIFHTNSLFVFRLPFAFFSLISTIFIYKIVKPFGKLTALFSTYLFAFCPLAIGLAGYIRIYELIPFMFILGVYIIFKKYSSWKQLLSYYGIYLIIFIFINLSDFDRFKQVSFILLILFATYIFSRLLNHLVLKKWLNLGIKLFVSILMFLVMRNLIPRLTNFDFHMANYSYLFFINYISTNQLWFFNFVPSLILLIIIFSSIIIYWKNSKIYSLFISGSIFLYFLIYFFSAPRIFQVRYAYILIIITIFIYATGVFSLSLLIKKYLRSSLSRNIGFFLFFLVLLFFIFSPFKAISQTVLIENGQFNLNNGLPYFDSQKLVSYLNKNNISDKFVLTTQPWVFDYYYNNDFLSVEEKKNYVFFPNDQWYEQFDRTKIYSVNGYWGVREINIINKLIKEQKIHYLVLHALPLSSDYKYSVKSILSSIENIEYVHTIDEDKYFGYYIFKVI